MTDTLTASSMYCAFDDEHLHKYGFRLPADPYWLAPPQGSIIPIWHRGGSPNYQPKPFIARHVQDPIRAWKRKISHKVPPKNHGLQTPKTDVTSLHTNARPVRIYYCSAGTTAGKLARRAEDRLRHLVTQTRKFCVATTQPLNRLSPRSLQASDIVLIIASSSGHGDIPVKGQDFVRAIRDHDTQSETEWAIFGNGDSTYVDSYNGAAKKLHTLLVQWNAKFLTPGYFAGDTAIENPPWSQLDQWFQEISRKLLGGSNEETSHCAQEPSVNITSEILSTFVPATMQRCTLLSPNVRRLVLNTGNTRHMRSTHAQMFVPNRSTDVKKFLKTFGFSGNEVIRLQSASYTIREILTHFVELERPFQHAHWTTRAALSHLDEKALLSLPISEVLDLLHGRLHWKIDHQSLCAALPISRTRHFSIASSEMDSPQSSSFEFFIKRQKGGKFSSRFLHNACIGTSIRVKFSENSSLSMMNDHSKPVIAFATGSGIAPIKYLLQQRIKQSRHNVTSHSESIGGTAAISIFVGFRTEDVSMVSSALQDAIRLNLLDILSLTPSNPTKRRAQDEVFNSKFRSMIISKIKDESCHVFVCASPCAAKEFSSNLDALLGRDVRDALGDRYIEEVFQAA